MISAFLIDRGLEFRFANNTDLKSLFEMVGPYFGLSGTKALSL